MQIEGLIAARRTSEVTDANLRKANLGACVLHSVQGLLLLVASQSVPAIKSFKKDVTTSFLVYDHATQALVAHTRTVGGVEIGLCAAIFILMSAVAHFYVLMNWRSYLDGINRETNVVRWYEYALSSSVMICAIAMLFGCYDLGSLILMFVVNALMNIFGLVMERMNPPGQPVTWEPFVWGCVAGAAPWAVVLMYFLGSGNFSEIPGFVYGILFGYFLFFNTFPVNMFLQYAKIGRWADYRHGERWYITLSLLSKSLLGWLVFGGCFQPDGKK